jgi:hypothetical protein
VTPRQTLPPDRPRRRLPGVLTLRDVEDVEARVADALDRLGPLPQAELDELVLDGIGLAYRIERALPPGTSLEPILQTVLDHRLRSRAGNIRLAA